MSVQKIIASAMSKDAESLREHFDAVMKERIRAVLEEKRAKVEKECSCDDEGEKEGEEKEETKDEDE